MIACFLMAMVFSSCDLRSESAKKGMERFTNSPTPAIPLMPTPSPVDPADVVEVDTSQEGESIPITGYDKRTTVKCTKFDRILVNGDRSEVVVKGVCRQIMVNGDSNKLSIDAAAEIVFNGTDNEIKYTRYPNGRQPIVVENRTGNIVEKVPVDTVTDQGSKRKIAK